MSTAIRRSSAPLEERNGGVSRRRFGAIASGALASLALGGGCHGVSGRSASPGRLTARPRTTAKTTASAAGRLNLGGERDALLRLPGAGTEKRLSLLVLLHGAGGTGAGILRRLGPAAEKSRIAVLAPDSRGSTWDAIRGGFGADVDFLNRALERVFDTVSVDPDRVAVGGFSDGATYALSLGLVNGDLFRRVLAFSPGFIVDGPPQGRPRFFVSHGIADPILPIDRCSRTIVPALRQRGYEVTFREFEGGHEVPAGIAEEGMRWLGL